jgi:hypothetical protein
MAETDVSRIGNMEQQVNKLIATIVLVGDGSLRRENGACLKTGQKRKTQTEDENSGVQLRERPRRQVNLKTGHCDAVFARVRWLLSFARPVIA